MPVPSRPPCRIVIVGGGYAGLTAAQRLSALAQTAAITLVDARLAFQQRVRLHQVAAGQTVASFPYQDFLEPRGVSFLHAQTLALDANAALLTVKRADGAVEAIGYDYLVYAPGSAPAMASVAGARENAHTFHDAAAAAQMHRALGQPGTSRVLVVGGGLTGIETAVELAESQPHLTVSLALDRPWRAETVPGGFSGKAVAYLDQALKRHRVALRTDARVSRLHAHAAETSDGHRIPFDLCVWTIGFAPPPLARDAGVRVNQQGQVVTDASLRSVSHPNLIAVGDAAAASAQGAGGCRMGSATGLAMGAAGARTVAALIKGEPPPVFRFAYLFRNLSLGRRDGLVQFVDRRDAPRNLVWTGAKAVEWKEYICRSTLSTVGLSAAERVPALPPLRMLPQLLRGIRQYG